MNMKKLIVMLLIFVVLLVGGTILVSVLKPKMHGTFNIENLIIKKEVKQ